MAHAKLTLTLPKEVWVGDLTRQYPEATVRVLAALSEDTAGVGLAEISSEDLPDLLATMEGYDAVTALEVLNAEDTDALVQFETTMAILLVAAQASGIPLEMPFEISDGTAVWEVTAPRDRLSALGDQLETVGVDFRVDYVQQHHPDEELLTERQERLLRTAIEAGYYDTPRQCSLTELAGSAGIAKSTASETLHRAEEQIIKQYAASLDN